MSNYETAIEKLHVHYKLQQRESSTKATSHTISNANVHNK